MCNYIDLNKPIIYHGASFRFFNEGERHITRKSFNKDVLLMVFEGTLHFTEDGVDHNIHKGEYYIQKKNTFQSANKESNMPKYLYVHFDGQWNQNKHSLAHTGNFSLNKHFDLMKELDRLYHSNADYTSQAAIFYQILTMLANDNIERTPANEIAQYISKHYLEGVYLDDISKKTHFSKNHIINIFKKEYGTTPLSYVNSLKLSRAEYLLVVTSEEIEKIAFDSGFSNYSNFYKMFCKKNGMSPKEWRFTKRL